MELQGETLARIERYESLSRREKSELGRGLRRLGHSYGEIMDLIPVKKSTLATWCRDIELTEEQTAAITARSRETAKVPDTQRRRRAEVVEIRRMARSRFEDLRNDPVWVAGTVLYWGEGGKTRNDLKLANSDPRALRLFVHWTRKYLNPEADFSIQLHLHEGNDEVAARDFWRREIGLPEANFFKSYIKPHGTGHRKNRLPQGVCSVKVRRCSDAWHVAMEWVDVLADQLGLGSAGN